MSKLLTFVVALCMICSSACTTQQKENTGSLPVADFDKEHPAKDLLVSEHMSGWKVPMKYYWMVLRISFSLSPIGIS